MQVLKAVDPKTATGKTKELFGVIEQTLKRVPNMIQSMGNSPAILGAYLQFNQAFEETKMTPKLRGLITATVSEIKQAVCPNQREIHFCPGDKIEVTRTLPAPLVGDLLAAT